MRIVPTVDNSTGNYRDPVVRRWIAFPYDLQYLESSKKAALELLENLDHAWLEDGVLPLESSMEGSLADCVRGLREPIPLGRTRWRHWGKILHDEVGNMRRVSVFVSMDALVLAFELGRYISLIDAERVDAHWEDLITEFPTLPENSSAILGSWDHRIIEYTGDPVNAKMPRWALAPLGDEEARFMGGEHEFKVMTLAFVHAATPSSGEALDKLLGSENFAATWLAALKIMMAASRNYAPLRAGMDTLPKPCHGLDESMSLEEIERIALQNARALLLWQQSLALLRRFRISIESNLWNLCRKQSQCPGLEGLFNRGILLGETFKQQIAADEAHYGVTLDELGTTFEVSDLSVQLQEARHTRSINKLFVVLGFLGAFLSLGQIFTEQIKRPGVTPVFLIVIALVLIWVLRLVPKKPSRRR